MFKKQREEQQEEIWVSWQAVKDRRGAGAFYGKLHDILEKHEFGNRVRAITKDCYKQTGTGRPGIDPEVYFRMLMVGFFEGLGSERGIAARCADSLMIRTFLGYRLVEETPDHSSLSVIRNRLGKEVYQQVFVLMLEMLKVYGLLKGKNLGIDSSVIEANASLRELVNRNTEEAYWDYVKRLAAEAGVDPQDAEAVRRFDAKREGRKTSNQEWVNPHDPDAKVAKAKDGATDMLYKPENVVDLDSGVVVQATVRTADQGDTQNLAERVLEAAITVQEVTNSEGGKPVVTLTSDKGYFAIEELQDLQAVGIKTVVGDAHAAKRRLDKLQPAEQRTVKNAYRSVQSKYGKDLLEKRGQHLERGFAHILDAGGMRRTTLRGQENIEKRYVAAAMVYNLSQLLRKLIGVGTPKQAQALFLAWIRSLWLAIRAINPVDDLMERLRNLGRILLVLNCVEKPL